MNSHERPTGELPYGIAPEGYRLPETTRLGAVRLQVGDLDRSLEYYRRVLGLREMGRTGDRARLGTVGRAPHLIELVERKGATPVTRGGRLGLYHFAIRIPDRAALGRFAAHLARLGERVAASDHRVSEAFYLWDPDGLGIEVYADRPRKRWEHRDRQLLMSTDALDVRSLIREAGGESWTGMPEKTVMGHVHLHVGDLTPAETFYHRGLGLDKVVWSYPGALFLSAGGYHHHLGVNTWAREHEPASPDEAQLLEWELILPSGEDVGRVLASVEAEGHPVTRKGENEGAAAEPSGGPVGVVQDPWSNSLRIRSEGG